MLKKIFSIIKRIIVSSFVLYGYNLIVGPLNMVIPINIITVGLLTIFGVPALVGLITILVLVYQKCGELSMMLDDFKQEQPIAYKILLNSVKKNRCSHAYLFETKHYPKKNEFLNKGDCVFLNAKNVTSNDFCFEEINFITKEKGEIF